MMSPPTCQQCTGGPPNCPRVHNVTVDMIGTRDYEIQYSAHVYTTTSRLCVSQGGEQTHSITLQKVLSISSRVDLKVLDFNDRWTIG